MRSRRHEQLALAFIVAALILLVSNEGAHATDRFVSMTGNDQGGASSCNPAPCRTLGQALGQAVSGDIVKVAKGAYREHVIVNASGTWTVRGGYGLDFGEATRDVTKNRTSFHGGTRNRFLEVIAASGKTLSVGLDGFTVSNSQAGGIRADAQGGSVNLDLHRVTFIGNRLAHDNIDVFGGAMRLGAEGGGSVTASVTESVLNGNRSEFAGGALGLVAEDGSMTVNIAGSAFGDNRAEFTGGAIFMSSNVQLTVQDTTFSGNVSTLGGAISIDGENTAGATATIRRTIFVRNSTKTTLFTNVGGGTGFGGAIAIAVTNNGSLNVGLDGKGALKLENCVLQQNTAGSGGAIYAQTALVSGVSPLGSASLTLDLRNNTLVGNRAVDKFGAFGTPGGAIEVEAFGSSGAPGASSIVTGSLLNNIIRGNTSLGNPPSGDMIITPSFPGAATSFTLTTNDIGRLENFGALTATPDPQLDVDPRLTKRNGVVVLTAGSPMIGAGTCDGAPADDFQGDPRPIGTGLCGVDIGADQFVPAP